MATIALSNSSCVVLVDDADAGLINAHRWYAVKRGRCAERLYAEASVSGRTVLMHRLLAGNPAGKVVDHRNSDGLDNRRANLRICTQRENARNRVGRIGKASRGIRLRYGKWRARIMVDRHEINLGTFATEAEAQAAYDAAAHQHYGEFAYRQSADPNVPAADAAPDKAEAA